MSALAMHSAQAAPVTARQDWVDAAKGLGILLVVLGHAIVGVRDAGLSAPDSALLGLHFTIYTFHMPLFFLLAGLFVPRRVERDPEAFLRGLGPRIVWPYVFWSVVQLVVIDRAGALVNVPSPITPSRILALLWDPTSQFWFLHALFLMHVGAALVLRRANSWVLLALAMAAFGLKELFELSEAAKNFVRFAPFYAFGVLMAEHRPRWSLEGAHARLVTVVAAAAWLLLSLYAWRHGYGYWDTALLPAAVCGTYACVRCSQSPVLSQNSLLRYLGQASMPIYLMHVLFTAGTRIAGMKILGWHDPYLLSAAAFVVGLCLPLVILALARQFGATRALAIE
jgi:fucose 4-O-acetylase-like acetyltransferase